MKSSRRTFLKGTGAVSGALFVSRFTPDLGWVAPAPAPTDGSEPGVEVAEQWLPTTCWIGKQDCGVLARIVNGRLVKLEGDPRHPRNQGTLCPKGQAQIQAVYDPNRVKTPLVRTNAKGVTGQWRVAGWDEALDLVASKIDEARRKNPKLFVWQKGRSKAKGFYDSAFVKATGAEKLHHGAFCSDAGYRACEYTIGLHGVLHPDFRHTRYLLSLGWDITNGGGNKFCQITWHQQLTEARENGLRVVHVDPSRRVAGTFADRWLPIKPGTDIAFLLAIVHELIRLDQVDREFLSKYTNAAFLVQDDGTFVRVDGREQIWDTGSNSMRAADDADAVAALEGEYSTGHGRLRPAFELLKEHVSAATPEWAEGISGVSADEIRRVAREMGEAARIGSTMNVDGVAIPYRPVAIMAYHVSQQELGFQLTRAALLVELLLGAVEAVGGQRSDFTWKVHGNYEAFGALDEAIKDGPYGLWLKGSKFFPINSNNSSIAMHAINDPEKWELADDPADMVMLIHMANPYLSFGDQRAYREGLPKLGFIAVIDPWMSETADLFADVVLPAATMEKYEGPISATDQYTDAVTLRTPPMAPLFQSRGEIDIYLDLAERLGVLYGDGGYIDLVNGELKLDDAHQLSLDERPVVRDIFDRWAKSQGVAEGVAFFEQEGVQVKGAVSASKFYGLAADPPFSGIRLRLYGESLALAGEAMRQKGVGEFFWRQYTALPTWMPPTLEGSPAEYDLYLVSRKMMEFKQSRSTFVPLLHELAPRQFLEINAKAADERGIADGDEVWIESHNAVTGETRRVKSIARTLESIRPDTVSLPHHFGFFSNPITRDNGPTANELFFSGEGYVSNTADQSFHVKVRVERA